MKRKWRLIVPAVLLAAVMVTAPLAAQGLRDLESKVVMKTLPNGLKVILLPRHDSPVMSMVTYADVGGVDENQNATGLAHIFEHMAFKGTTTIGTTDYKNEKLALARVDKAFLALRAERLRRPHPDSEKIKVLEARLKTAQDEAEKFVVPNEFTRILKAQGAQGINAFTTQDQTVYHYSLPSNRLELWAMLVSDRFSHPVLREFYKEKDVIMEEKRMGENNPVQRLLIDFMPVAFKASMYRSFVIGWMSDLQNISRQDAENWFAKYYRAKNLTCVVVGDIDPRTAMPILEKYLSRIPAGTKPGPVITREPVQREEKRLIMEDPSQPFLVIGYHRPDVNDPDDVVYDVINDLMGNGPSSRLNKSLVKDKKLALAAGSISNLQQKYPGLFLFFAVPNQGKTNAECENAIYEELNKLKTVPVSKEELDGVKARKKAEFIDQAESNMGLALRLAFNENLTGDWRNTFNLLERIDKVTPEDIMRVANKTFKRSNRTVGMIETTSGKDRKGGK